MLQLLPHERVNNIVELDSIANLFTNKTGDNIYKLSLSILVTLVRGKYHCTIHLLFDWFGLVCFANKNKNCHLSYS